MGKIDIETFFHKNPQIRQVFEALLIDEATPDKVFTDLFGVDMDFVNTYKNSKNGPWGKPRLLIFAEIQNMKGKAQELATKVFDGGWEQLDALFNHGRNVNAADAALKIVRIAAAKAGIEAINADRLPIQLINAAKSMVAASSQHATIEGAGRDESWEILVQELSDKESARALSPSIADACKQIFKDLKNKTPYTD